MSRWLARLRELDAPPPGGTDKTDKTPLLAVLAVTPGGGDGLHEAAPDLSAVAWTDADVARFLDRRARLLRWGWAEPDADALAERLLQRDRDVDVRVACVDCKHYRPGRCGNHKRAGLGSDEVGRDLAGLLQRCDGFVSWRDWR